MVSPLQRQILDLLCDVIPACVIAIDTHRRIVFFNQNFENFTGIPRRTVLGRNIRETLTEISIDTVKIYLSHALQHGLTFINKEATFTIADRTAVMTIDTIPIYNRQDKIIGALSILKDIDHLRESERYMKHLETQAAIGQTAAGLTHELRNPLTAIKGFTQLIHANALSPKNPEIIEKYCNVIIQEIESLNTILSNFLSLSQSHTNDFVTLDIVQVVKDVLTIMYGEAILSNKNIIQHLPDDPLPMRGSGKSLKEVLINICRNAFQAMPSGGTLTVTVESDAEQIIINLADTGNGMTPETMAHIFKPLFTTKPTGTGLGLSICLDIMHEHGGDIKVTSTPGQGSTFSLIFPRKQS